MVKKFFKVKYLNITSAIWYFSDILIRATGRISIAHIFKQNVKSAFVDTLIQHLKSRALYKYCTQVVHTKQKLLASFLRPKVTFSICLDIHAGKLQPTFNSHACSYEKELSWSRNQWKHPHRMEHFVLTSKSNFLKIDAFFGEHLSLMNEHFSSYLGNMLFV